LIPPYELLEWISLVDNNDYYMLILWGDITLALILFSSSVALYMLFLRFIFGSFSQKSYLPADLFSLLYPTYSKMLYILRFTFNNFVAGTKWFFLYTRVMVSKVGKCVYLNNAVFLEHNLLTIGNDTIIIDTGTYFVGHEKILHVLSFGKVIINSIFFKFI
jgi:hypothetical protein